MVKCRFTRALKDYTTSARRELCCSCETWTLLQLQDLIAQLQLRDLSSATAARPELCYSCEIRLCCSCETWALLQRQELSSDTAARSELCYSYETWTLRQLRGLNSATAARPELCYSCQTWALLQLRVMWQGPEALQGVAAARQINPSWNAAGSDLIKLEV